MLVGSNARYRCMVGLGGGIMWSVPLPDANRNWTKGTERLIASPCLLTSDGFAKSDAAFLAIK